MRALLDAEHYHHEQARKGTDIPYISHPLAVCSLVLEAGGTETEAIAALLHDAAEDADAGGELILRAIEANYDAEVATIVSECSDALPGKGEEKPPWLKRKQTYISRLRDAGASSMLVSAADKLHNLRAIYSDFQELGDRIWNRFNAPEPKKEHVLGYYGSLQGVYVDSESPRDPRRKRITDAVADLLTSLGYRAEYAGALVAE